MYVMQNWNRRVELHENLNVGNYQNSPWNYCRSGHFCFKNIFVVCTNHKNKKHKIYFTFIIARTFLFHSAHERSDSSIIRLWLILKQRFTKLIKVFVDELFTFGMLNFRFNLGNFFP